MRKVILVEFISIDNVIQAPGGPDEDTSDGFKFGGWLAPFFDQALGEALEISYGQPYDLLLGKKTYDIFAGYWPKVAAQTEGISETDRKFALEFDACTKYVATHNTDSLKWKNSKSLGLSVTQEVDKLRKEDGKNLLVIGSSKLAHTLLAHDLVDEMHLMIAPIILGKGKRLFDENSRPTSFKLNRSAVSTTGMLLMHYLRDGEVKTGSVA
ncbi:dihydrofolate reductase family protein [Peredibacter starrii]|uniref:Dihydrofolate reductase family protein n=1 Tax=Peredibacter starrii TaxID=28202 RepID=A0AAX4HNM5_9BACT|nr:dihydrofolate reductase family protein [Peredibacter starrii]WPU64539.1 dihydrofolate reductase family protein [Peredibacter starrii]